jgi:ribosomal protein L6P/L9E
LHRLDGGVRPTQSAVSGIGGKEVATYAATCRADDLPEDLQQRSINYGEQQRQQKAKAAAKRANRQ